MATLPAGAVALWGFNNINGVLAPDSVGGDDGVIVGATALLGNGLAFDGVDDFVSIPDSPAFDFGSSNFTIDFWANFAAAPGGSLGHPGDVFISQDEGAGSQNKWFLSAYSGFIDFHVNSPSLGPQFFAITPFNPTPGQWYNIALTRSGSHYTMYINGVAAGSATETFAIPNVSAPLTIGQSDEAFGGYVNGDLEQVAIFNRALTSTEVQQVYADGPGGVAPPPVLQLSTYQAGDTGPFTLSISSATAVLEPGATVTLSLMGQPNIVSASTTVNATDTGLSAAFNLSGQTDGSYAVTINNPDGSTYTVGSPLQLEPVNTPQLWSEIIGPSGVRASTPASFALEFGNTGNVDAANADILLVAGPGVNLSIQTTAHVTQYTETINTTSGPEAVQVYQIPVTDVPAGSVNVLPFTVETAASGGTIQLGGTITPPLTLSALAQEIAITGSTTIDWSSLESSFKSPSIDSTDWNLIWNRLVAEVGTTTQSLLTALSSAATTLSDIGEPTTVVSALLGYELEQASGILPHITLADTTDIADNAGGLELSLSRTYSASLLNRNNPGPFGDGWTFTYGISAVTDASGNVYITSPSGVEFFTLQSGGIYTAQPGESSVLTLSGGAYVLTSINGTVEHFLPTGQISSITDSNGNTVTVSYHSGVISGVTSSNGQSLTFTTNAQGRITSATNGAGQTVTYTYDSTGDLLLSASDPVGTTSYTYDNSGNPVDQNALTLITNPDGTTRIFQYDSQGDLMSQSGSGGAGQVTYSYPGTGTIIGTDAAGDTATLIFGTNGNLAGIKDPLGNVTQLQYNANNELTGGRLPTGATYAFSYGANGNLTGYTDPDGGVVSATYTPGTDLLTGFTDQNGNATSYNYNATGNLIGITYDDGSGTSYQYSSSGQLTSSTDADGQTTTYAYNAQGLLTLESFSDGTFQAYTYNSHGELTSAQATSGGVTSYGYNAAGELTSVTNPSGQVETYTYNNGGQELTRTEPDGSVTQYGYNAVGQLAELQDGSGNLITQYSYNALGELTGSLDGNGQTTTYQYDANGNVTQILTQAADGTTTSQLDYTYDAGGQPITATLLDGTWTYAYDASGQLTNAVFASTNPSIADQNLTYEYDAAGNRTETIFNGAVNDYTTNGRNQYTAANGTTYDYDTDGNLISMTQSGVTTTYTYNSQNQLTAESGPAGNFTYQYDALGNMISSTDNGAISNYIIDPLAISTSATGPLSAIAQAYDATGNVSATYDYGDGLAAMINSSGTDYYNADATGNVTSLSGAGSSLVDTYDYSPFGTLLASTGSVSNPFQYSGSWGVTTGADGLVDMRARYYNPALGRFLSRDPIGLSGGTNGYTYVANNPTNAIDPTGKWIFFILLGEAFLADIGELALAAAVRSGAAALVNDLLFTPVGQVTLGVTVGATGIGNYLPPGRPYVPEEGDSLAQLGEIDGELFEDDQDQGTPFPSLPIIPLPTFPIVNSSDPNDISGPQGVGAARLVNDTTPLGYQIGFENLATASAPAQSVVITDQLDLTKVNLSTFSLGPITFGNEILTPPAASSSYTTIVDLRPANNLLVKVAAGLNTTTGLVTWTFTSLDPTTGQPTTNPLAGFLPPDVTPPKGEGSVTFFVQPNSGLTTGTKVTDSASIVFDKNAPISTSQWVNTIDTGPIASNGAVTEGHGQTVDLTSLINGLVTAAAAGDTETLTSVTASLGSGVLSSGNHVTYTAPTSGPDTITYTVEDETGNTATGQVTVTVDPGPKAGNATRTEGHGQTVDLTTLINGLIKAGITGDTETLTSVSATKGNAVLGPSNAVSYTAPAIGPDTISYTATDQYGDMATGQVAVTVDLGPAAANGAVTEGHGKTANVTALVNSLITPGIPGDTETLTSVTAIQGNAVLGPSNTVTYTAPAIGPDTISYTVTDQYGDTATGQVAVTVDLGPAAANGAVTEGSGTTADLTALIGGLISPGIAGDTETLTSVSATLGTVVLGPGNTVTYTAPAAGLDAISYTVTDQYGDTATGHVAVAVVPSGKTFNLTKNVDIVAGGPGDDAVNATTGTLTSGDQIDGGGGKNTLNLLGGGTFNLSLPTTLANIQVINAQEGQAAYSAGGQTFQAQNQIITLRDNLNATVNVSAATINAANPKPVTITIVGAHNTDVINLASGNDTVTVGDTRETVNGGTGNDTIYVTAATIGANINGGTGQTTLDVTGGGVVTEGNSVTNIATVLLGSAPAGMKFTANGESGLVINDQSGGATSVTAGGVGQTISGGSGHDTFIGFSGGGTTFKDLASAISGDTIADFGLSGTMIDLTNVTSATVSLKFSENAAHTSGTLTVTDGTHAASMILKGSFAQANFHTAMDSATTGTLISYS